MDNTIEKRIQSLNDRLSYTRDIFAGKHEDSIRLLDEKLTEFTNRVRNGEVEDPHTEIVSLEDLFVFVEKRLEKLITPMDRVRIVRHPQRICLRDILETSTTTSPKWAARTSTASTPACSSPVRSSPAAAARRCTPSPSWSSARKRATAPSSATAAP